MSGFCRYSGAFGAPGSGAHSIRIGGLAAVDLLASAGLAYLGMRTSGRESLPAFAVAFVLVLLVAVATHEAFCVNTRLNAALFGRPWPGLHPAMVPGPGPGP